MSTPRQPETPPKGQASPRARFLRAGELAIATCATLLLGSALAAAETLDEPLRTRRDADTSEAAVAVYEHLALERPNDTSVCEHLVRARYFLALRYRDGDAATEEHKRAINDGLKGLSRVIGVKLDDIDELDDRRDRIPKTAVGILFWTTVAYASTIESLSVFTRPAAAKRLQRLLRRAVTLDETYFHGGPCRVLAELLNNAPFFLGGDEDEARTQATRAVEIAPRFAENHIVWAEVVAVQDDDERAYRGALERARAIAPNTLPDCIPEQRWARKRAQTLLEKASSRF